MSEMVERVAKALYRCVFWPEGDVRVRAGNRWFTKEDYDPDLAWKLCCEEGGENMRHYLERARAVITAMREPTDEMCGEAGDPYGDGVRSSECYNIWQTMIDEALK